MTTRAGVTAVAVGVLFAVTGGSPGHAAPLGPGDTDVYRQPVAAPAVPPQTATKQPAPPGPLGITPLPSAPLSGAELLSTVQRRATQVESAHETLAEEQAVLTDLRDELAVHTEQVATLDSELGARQQRTDEVARSAYMSALSNVGSNTPALMSLFPPTVDTQSAARDEMEQVRATFEQDAQRERDYAAAVAGHEAEFDTALAELTQLRARNDAEISTQQKTVDDQRAQTGRQILAGFGGPNSKGMVPGPAAVRAVQFAVSQLGKPYVFGAEGLDAYDCSGIVQRAYGENGVRLPRTARPQYRATTPVAISDLLTGDLIFFGTDRGDWNSIFHVGIYMGNGEILHAPMPGDHLRIAPIWWEDFFGATRVVPAVQGPAKPKPSPHRPTPRTPSPNPSKTATPAPKPPSPAPAPSASPASPSPAPPSPPVAPDTGGSPAPSADQTQTPSPSSVRVRLGLVKQNVGIAR